MHLSRRSTLATLPVLFALLALPRAAAASDLYSVTLNVDGQTFSRSFGDIDEARSLLNLRGLMTIAPNYTPGASVSGVVDVRGLPVRFSTIPGTAALQLSAPAAGFNRVFDAGDPVATQNQVLNFLRGNESKQGLRRLVRGLVATSTSDPIAGNPASLLGQSVIADHTIGTLPPGDNGDMSPRRAGWHVTMGVFAQHQDTRDYDTNTYSIPLGVSYAFGEDGPEAFLHVPVMLSATEGNDAYMGTGALGLRVPVVKEPALRWALTPSLRWGAAGSWDSGTVGQTYGGSLTSDLRVALGDITLGLGNSVGYHRTEPLKYGSIEINYNLNNWSFRNGVSLSKPAGEVAGRSLVVGLSLIDTRLHGDDLAVDAWQEYGVSATIGTQVPLRVSASYLDGNRGYSGYRLGMTLAF
jgi:hypothetical protein